MGKAIQTPLWMKKPREGEARIFKTAFKLSVLKFETSVLDTQWLALTSVGAVDSWVLLKNK